jgi:hypothetical protein
MSAPIDIEKLPDSALIPREQTAEILHVSLDTLDRMSRAPDTMLKRVNVSPRRVCLTAGSIRRHIHANSQVV